MSALIRKPTPKPSSAARMPPGYTGRSVPFRSSRAAAGKAAALPLSRSAMRELLRQGGVAENMIWTEEESISTHENAVFAAKILRGHQIDRVALVVNARSMPRAAAVLEKQGIRVSPAPSSFRRMGRIPGIAPRLGCHSGKRRDAPRNHRSPLVQIARLDIKPIARTFEILFAFLPNTYAFFPAGSRSLACYFQIGKRSCAPLARPQQFLSWPGYVALCGGADFP